MTRAETGRRGQIDTVGQRGLGRGGWRSGGAANGGGREKVEGEGMAMKDEEFWGLDLANR